jgi:hypothetical protein
MRFADPGRAKDQDVFGWGEKASRRQLADEPLIDRGLEFELEVIERFHSRKMGNLQSHRHAGPLLRVDFLAQDTVEEIEIGRLGPGGIIEHGIETVGDIPESELRELLDDTSVNDHAQWPPSTTAA